MIKINGIFKVQEIKEVGNKKIIKLIHTHKNKDGSIANSYFNVWVNDKVSKMVTPELKRNMKDKLITVEGYLLMETKEVEGKKFVNNTIFPSSIEQYSKGDK